MPKANPPFCFALISFCSYIILLWALEFLYKTYKLYKLHSYKIVIIIISVLHLVTVSMKWIEEININDVWCYITSVCKFVSLVKFTLFMQQIISLMIFLVINVYKYYKEYISITLLWTLGIYITWLYIRTLHMFSANTWSLQMDFPNIHYQRSHVCTILKFDFFVFMFRGT